MRPVTSVDPVNRAFDVLAHHYRRYVLADLDGRSAPVALTELAARTAAWEERQLGEPALRDRVEAALHHRHLPLLETTGLLTYRPDEGAVVDWRPLDLTEGWLAAPTAEPVLRTLCQG